MKFNKTQLLTALLGAALTFTSLTVNAEEAGFTLDESIRAQVFMELKSNVKSLYQHSYLIGPDTDTAASSGVIARTGNTGFTLPVNHKAVYGKEGKTAKNIN